MDSPTLSPRALLRRSIGETAYGSLRNLYRGTLGSDIYLRQTTGLIHVGGNVGQERDLYDFFNMDVIWVEPIPEVFEELKSNISGFSKQRAYQRLLTDVDGAEYTFHVANNKGESSSLYELSKHRKMWPEVHYTHDLHLRSTTLAALVREERIELGRFQTLVMDTQGSEILVLKGAEEALSSFRFIKTEAADFEAYAGCCRADELTAFLRKHGYIEQRRKIMKSVPGVGLYWDILYRRSA